MKTEKGTFYTTGEFAKMANVSLRTVRFYDTKGLLKPSMQTDAGYRLYTDEDFVRLQRILTLKYLGFSLEEIADICVRDTDAGYVRHSLSLQQELVEKKVEGLRRVSETLGQTIERLDAGENVDWKRVLNLIHMVNMEGSLAEQYKNGSNLNIRIRLHDDYSVNKQGWFSWIFEQMMPVCGRNILEIGCGNGQLWSKALENHADAFEGTQVVLTDISQGMVLEAKNRVGERDGFSYVSCGAVELPFEDETFDMEIGRAHV